MRAHHIHAQGTQNRHSMSLVTNAADDANDQKKILHGNRSRQLGKFTETQTLNPHQRISFSSTDISYRPLH